MTDPLSETSNCAHYISKYLPLTENWIYRILINHRRFIPYMLSRKEENLNLFPIPHIYCLCQLSKLRQIVEIGFFRTLGYFLYFRKICKEFNVRLLHVHFGYHGVKNIGLKKILNIPMICSFYGYDAFTYPRLKNNRNKYARLFDVTEKVLVLGPCMKNELIRLGCPEQKITIHHLGIDINKIRFEKRFVKKGDTLRFLIAASFVPKKGIDLALKALAAFKDTHNYTLDIIGDGPMKNKIFDIISEKGLNDKVKFHGYKPYEYFINLAYSCDVFIQASRTGEKNNKEGTPMAIVDVMATGMPVISTRHSDIPEMVIDGYNGYLSKENDQKSLEICIHEVFNNTEKIEELSTNSRNWVEKEFDARKQTIKLEELYNELLQQ